MQFLSEEWTEAVKNAVASSEEFKAATASQHVRIQQVVTMPDGSETRYWMTIDGGDVDMGTGGVDNADATISQDYDTAVALSKGELSPTAAFMGGKVKVDGLMKVMGLQGAMGLLGSLVKGIPVEYETP
jgi:putative sterol carrier protein